MMGSCEQIVNLLSASNEWPQNCEIIELGEDDEQRSLNMSNNKNKKMMIAKTSKEEGGCIEKAGRQDEALKCPRCESTNTKFCYYNNYSLSQPRHFCKACKRYWTRGGTLRNVPVGGACRKNKRFRRNPNFSSTTNTPNSPTNISHQSNTSGICGGGSHLITPFLYGLPTNLVPHESIINGFPSFSSTFENNNHNHLGGIELGFSSTGMINGYSTNTNPKRIVHDFISNSNPMSVSSLLTSRLQHHQQKFNFETLLPYELDSPTKGVSNHGNNGVFMKDMDSVKLEENDRPHGQCQFQNGSYDHQIHDDHQQQRQQQRMGDSDPSMLWNSKNANATTGIGGNWVDPNYSNLGSSSVPSLI